MPNVLFEFGFWEDFKVLASFLLGAVTCKMVDCCRVPRFMDKT